MFYSTGPWSKTSELISLKPDALSSAQCLPPIQNQSVTKTQAAFKHKSTNPTSAVRCQMFITFEKARVFVTK